MPVLNPGWSTLFKPQPAAAYWRGLACGSRKQHTRQAGNCCQNQENLIFWV